MIASTSASMAARKGGRCVACISLQSESITGKPRWASTGAWPLPGKCLAQAETPAARPHRERVGEDGHAAPQHDDAPALVIRGHEEAPAQSLLEAVEQTGEAL